MVQLNKCIFVHLILDQNATGFRNVFNFVFLKAKPSYRSDKSIHNFYSSLNTIKFYFAE